MVDFFTNASILDVVEALPPELSNSIGTLVTILKAIGIVVLIYLIYMITNGVLKWRTNKRIKKIHKIVEEIDRKLDIVFKKKHKKQEKEDKKKK